MTGSESPQPLRVNPLRPLTAATLVVAAGLLAALPFRRASQDTCVQPSDSIATGPRSSVIDSASPGRAEWADGQGFDSSLAWQPVPMTLPPRPGTELPPMPDSYYDVAFDLEQPDPIRQRFSAAAANRPEQANIPVGSEPRVTSAVPQSEPLQPRSSERPAQQQVAAEDLVKDRFVYTPIQPPKPPQGPAEDSKGQRGIHAHSASMVRSGGTSDDADAGRPRLFIREPQ